MNKANAEKINSTKPLNLIKYLTQVIRKKINITQRNV